MLVLVILQAIVIAVLIAAYIIVRKWCSSLLKYAYEITLLYFFELDEGQCVLRIIMNYYKKRDYRMLEETLNPSQKDINYNNYSLRSRWEMAFSLIRDYKAHTILKDGRLIEWKESALERLNENADHTRQTDEVADGGQCRVVKIDPGYSILDLDLAKQ